MIYDFGYRLQELRRKKRMTQEQVAKRLGLSKTTISGYENNVKTPSLQVLTKLAILYGASSDFILGLDNRKMIEIDELTASQEDIIRRLVAEFQRQPGQSETKKNKQ